MATLTSKVFRGLGFDPKSADPPLSSVTPSEIGLFRFFRVLFGAIWLYDAWTVSSGATKHAMAQFLGLPFSSTTVHLVGTAIMFLTLYVALALISGNGMRSALWIGIVYLLVMWIGVEHGGDFNPATGGTDAGIAPPYLIALILTYLTWRISQPLTATGENETHHLTRLWMQAARLLFGFLWAWDALFKLHPYFITHMVDFISAAESGQPVWIVAYLHLWIALIHHTSPLFFGIVSALAEVAIAWSLLSGKLLRIFLPFGFVFSLMIWSTAEGFGGPYGDGFTGMPGNMFGTAVIYALIFAYFIAIYRWSVRNNDAGHPRRRRPVPARQDS